MKRFKLTLAILIGKLAAFFCHLFPFLGGTALPGLIALKIDPQLVKNIRQRNQLQSIVITGTNGKTTTSRLLAQILKTAKQPFVQNRTGSNLLRGLASSLISQASLSGRLPLKLALWEVDEAVVPVIIDQVKPRIILFTNLFRDQLDRYGEIDTILKNWRSALKKLPSNSQIVINIDDPSLNYLGRKASPSHHVVTYGLNHKKLAKKRLAHAADAIFCPHCHAPLQFSLVFTSHLGHYSCSQCSFKRNQPQFSLEQTVSFSLPGAYNLYNLLAATTIAQLLAIPAQTIKQALKTFQPAFGRAEEFKLQNKTIYIHLVKNPAGFNAVLETLQQQQHLFSSPLLIAINDLTADGKDVSWLWDVDFELLNQRQTPVIVSGIRAYDIALRLKYAGLKQSLIRIEPSLKQALLKLQQTPSQPLYILPTYTAMLAIRELLRQQKVIHSTWKD